MNRPELGREPLKIAKHCSKSFPPAARKVVPAWVVLLLVLPITMWAVNSAASDKEKEWTLARDLYGDKKARKVGDLLTVLIEEQSEASKDAKSTSSKKVAKSGSLNFGNLNVDNAPTGWTNVAVPAWSVDISRSYDGGGSVENKEKLSSTMTVQVTEVLPNGNLLIEGKRSLVVQNETIVVTLTGTVRPEDISRDNIVKSSSIANAAIKYASSGPTIREQKRGILTRLWNWVNPF